MPGVEILTDTVCLGFLNQLTCSGNLTFKAPQEYQWHYVTHLWFCKIQCFLHAMHVGMPRVHVSMYVCT